MTKKLMYSVDYNRKLKKKISHDKHRISQSDYSYDTERIKKEIAYDKLLIKLNKVKSEKTKNRLINEFIRKYHHKEGG